MRLWRRGVIWGSRMPCSICTERAGFFFPFSSSLREVGYERDLG